MESVLTVVACVLLIALGYLGIVDWGRSSTDQKIERIEQLVQAAEQIYKKQPGQKPGPERLRWVMERLGAYYKTKDTAELRELVEAAVFRVNAMGKAANAKIDDAGSKIDDAGGAYWLGSGKQT